MASAAKSAAKDRYSLTPDDIDLCDSFQALLKRIVYGNGGCVAASVSWIANGAFRPFPTASVSDIHECFIADYEPRRIAAQLQESIDKLRAANPNEEDRKAKRVADLKAELERLEAAEQAAA